MTSRCGQARDRDTPDSWSWASTRSAAGLHTYRRLPLTNGSNRVPTRHSSPIDRPRKCRRTSSASGRDPGRPPSPVASSTTTVSGSGWSRLKSRKPAPATSASTTGRDEQGAPSAASSRSLVLPSGAGNRGSPGPPGAGTVGRRTTSPVAYRTNGMTGVKKWVTTTSPNSPGAAGSPVPQDLDDHLLGVHAEHPVGALVGDQPGVLRPILLEKWGLERLGDRPPLEVEQHLAGREDRSEGREAEPRAGGPDAPGQGGKPARVGDQHGRPVGGGVVQDGVEPIRGKRPQVHHLVVDDSVPPVPEPLLERTEPGLLRVSRPQVKGPVAREDPEASQPAEPSGPVPTLPQPVPVEGEIVVRRPSGSVDEKSPRGPDPAHHLPPGSDLGSGEYGQGGEQGMGVGGGGVGDPAGQPIAPVRNDRGRVPEQPGKPVRLPASEFLGVRGRIGLQLTPDPEGISTEGGLDERENELAHQERTHDWVSRRGVPITTRRAAARGPSPAQTRLAPSRAVRISHTPRRPHARKSPGRQPHRLAGDGGPQPCCHLQDNTLAGLVEMGRHGKRISRMPAAIARTALTLLPLAVTSPSPRDRRNLRKSRKRLSPANDDSRWMRQKRERGTTSSSSIQKNRQGPGNAAGHRGSKPCPQTFVGW